MVSHVLFLFLQAYGIRWKRKDRGMIIKPEMSFGTKAIRL